MTIHQQLYEAEFILGKRRNWNSHPYVPWHSPEPPLWNEMSLILLLLSIVNAKLHQNVRAGRSILLAALQVLLNNVDSVTCLLLIIYGTRMRRQKMRLFLLHICGELIGIGDSSGYHSSVIISHILVLCWAEAIKMECRHISVFSEISEILHLSLRETYWPVSASKDWGYTN